MAAQQAASHQGLSSMKLVCWVLFRQSKENAIIYIRAFLSFEEDNKNGHPCL
jgi:hypothetical protein